MEESKKKEWNPTNKLLLEVISTINKRKNVVINYKSNCAKLKWSKIIWHRNPKYINQRNFKMLTICKSKVQPKWNENENGSNNKGWKNARCTRICPHNKSWEIINRIWIECFSVSVFDYYLCVLLSVCARLWNLSCSISVAGWLIMKMAIQFDAKPQSKGCE